VHVGLRSEPSILFSRNHDDLHSIPQEPYLWPSVTQVAKTMLGARYSLLTYYYTLFYQAHANGGTVARPLFFEFPSDTNTYSIDQQFLIGSSLMISPVLTQGANSVTAYFPNAKWYSFWDYTLQQQNGRQTLPCSWQQLPVHIRGGSVIPTQTPAMTSAATRVNPFALLVAPDEHGQAAGALYYDDGESLDVGAQSLYVQYSLNSQLLAGTVLTSTYSGPPVQQITIMGVNNQVSQVALKINGVTTSPAFQYNTSTKVVTIQVSIPLTSSFTLSWS